MAIPECLLAKAEQKGDLDMFECPFPVRYVLEKGYRMVDAHVVCDGYYDENFGLEISEEYYEVQFIQFQNRCSYCWGVYDR